MASGVQRSLGVVEGWGCRQLQIVFAGEVVELSGKRLDSHWGATRRRLFSRADREACNFPANPSTRATFTSCSSQ